ncbi:hypothetical protein B0T16DRAFT_45434 [Cercophora newfieldiana]|uniref:Uncharacterized protein n=1 Tax=Cercophora newfieldiana TaxID=92897 RepID=A0AA39YQH2_9PEZI|nr:hypothetical protein B0T16DRAFT_45434 [Cercophora newfieldiana]
MIVLKVKESNSPNLGALLEGEGATPSGSSLDYAAPSFSCAAALIPIGASDVVSSMHVAPLYQPQPGCKLEPFHCWATPALSRFHIVANHKPSKVARWTLSSILKSMLDYCSHHHQRRFHHHLLPQLHIRRNSSSRATGMTQGRCCSFVSSSGLFGTERLPCRLNTTLSTHAHPQLRTCCQFLANPLTYHQSRRLHCSGVTLIWLSLDFVRLGPEVGSVWTGRGQQRTRVATAGMRYS